MRAIIGAVRLFIFLLSCGVTIAYQSVVFLFTRGPFAYIYPRAYHEFLCKLLGLRVIVEGEIACGKNILYVSNHISYLDIQVLGSLVHGAFVAKKDVEKWPIFGIVGKMGQTLYVSRSPQDAPRETAIMAERLDRGMPLIIFPEGTSSDGRAVLPFKSSFFQILLDRPVRVQPVTISVIEIDGKPANTQELRNRYAWYGDMTLEPHLWWMAKSRGATIRVQFHPPLLATDYTDRKHLSADAHRAVAKGLDLIGTGS